MERRFKKTELDSKRSLYDGMIDRGEERQARDYLASVVAKAEQELIDRAKKLEVAQAKLKAKKDERETLLGNVERARQGEGAARRARPTESSG